MNAKRKAIGQTLGISKPGSIVEKLANQASEREITRRERRGRAHVYISMHLGVPHVSDAPRRKTGPQSIRVRTP